MKPYPLSSLNHFTVPWAISGARLSLLGLHRNKKAAPLTLRAALLTDHKTHIYLLHPYYTTTKGRSPDKEPWPGLRSYRSRSRSNTTTITTTTITTVRTIPLTSCPGRVPRKAWYLKDRSPLGPRPGS